MKNKAYKRGGNYGLTWSRPIIATFVNGVFLFVSSTISLQAAAITWNPPVNCSADTDVLTNNGVAKYAYDWSSAQTVNGVAFAVAGSAMAAGTNITLAFANATSTAYTNTTSSSAFNALSTAYKSVLTGGAYKDASGVSATVTLNNLTVGHTYAVQYWVSDPRGTTRQETLTSTGGNTVTLTYCSTGSTAGGVGMYSIGNFTAGANSQSFTVETVGSDGDVQINALQVRDTAGSITWGSPTDIIGDSDVFTNGQFVYAYDWSGGNSTVNGVTFTGASSTNAGGINVGLAGFNGNTLNAYSSTADPYAALSSEYKTILQGGDYNSGANVAVTLSNLVVGNTYEVQVWVNDPRGPYNSRTETITGEGNTVTLDYSTGGGSTAGYPGQYVVGNFTANGMTQTFTLAGSASAQLNALEARNTTGALLVNYWGGYVNGSWDSTTTNWGYGQSFTTVTSFYTNANFADTNNEGNAVVNTNISIQSSGVSIGTVDFLNNSVGYTITNAGGTAGITGPTAIIKSGSGTLTLAGPNTYTGLTTVGNGVLNVYGNQSLATGGWYLGSSLNNGMTVNFESGSIICVAGSSGVSLDETYGALGSTANLNVVGNVTNNGSLAVQRAGILAINSGGNWMQSGTMTVGPNGYTGYSADLIVNGGGFVYSGTGNLNLNSSASGSGSAILAVAGGGTLITGQPFANATGSGTGSGILTLGNTNVAVSGPGTLQLSGNVTSLVAATGTGFNLQLGNGGGGFDTAGFSTTVNCAIGNVAAQVGSLTETGGGTLTLSATNTYSGSTMISNGTLCISGTIDSSQTITVAGANAGLQLTQSMALTNTAMLVVNAGGSVALSSGVNQTVGAFCLGGQWEPDGTYGSTASGAANQNNGYFSGTGMITVDHGTQAQSPAPLTIFDYGIRELYGFDGYNPAPGIISYLPFPGWDYVPSDYVYPDTYNFQYGNGLPVADFFIEQTGPIAQNTNADGSFMRSNSVPDALSWFTNNTFIPLNYVLTDYEPYDQSQSRCDAEITNTVNFVRAATTTNASSAYVGNYAVFPGGTDPALSFSSRIDNAAFYLNNGLTVAQPNAYAYAAYAANGPNARSGYFWSDLELVSFVKLNLPAGNKLLPWVNTMTTISDGDALLAQMRLRGVDGYCDLGGLQDQYYAWSDLDWLFDAAGDASVLNLTTSKVSGFQWSGYQVGPNFAFFFSNLGDSPVSQNFPGFLDLPAASPSIAAGTHTELFFVNDPASILANQVIYLGRDGINHGLYVNDTVTLANAIQIAMPGTNGAAAVTIGSDITGAFTPTFSGLLTLSNNVTLQSLGTAVVFSGSIGCTGAVTTTGNVILAGANSYSGGTEISSGNLVISNATSLGIGEVAIPKTGTNSGTLQLALTGDNVLTNTINGFNSTTFVGDSTVPDIENISGTNILTGGLTVTGTGGNGVAIQSDSGLLELAGTVMTTLTYRGLELNGAGNGLITGAVADGSDGISFGLVKDGTGTWTLSGTNVYSDGTGINNGILQVNGSLASGSAVTVGTNGILGGTGTVGGAVTLNGTVSPGSGGGVGTLTTGGEVWNGGGAYEFSLNNATSNSGQDSLKINGALNIQATSGSPFVIKLVSLNTNNTPGAVASFSSISNYVWTAATASGGITNFNPTSFVVNTAAFSNSFAGTFSVGTNGNSLVVNYTPNIPHIVIANSPPVLNGAVMGAKGFTLNFSGANGQSYRVLASTNLMLPLADWLVLTNGTFGAGVVDFNDGAATNVQQFYRVASPRR